MVNCAFTFEGRTDTRHLSEILGMDPRTVGATIEPPYQQAFPIRQCLEFLLNAFKL